MERWQKQHIQKNMVELMKTTLCNSHLLASLEASNILGSADIEALDLPHLAISEKSKKLFDILQTRVNAYDILIMSLEATKQSGAVKILKDHNIVYRSYGSITYDKNHVLGTGSPGTKVFKGLFGGRDIAVKVINADLVEHDKILKEVEFLKKLDSHNNIVRYFTAETNENYIYIALELCDISLQDAVKLNMLRLDPVTVLKKCTTGLAYLHKCRVIHRDLKPANVLLKGDRQVKITDFGLSKQIPAGMTSVSVYSGVVGTADWMAPEILQHLGDESEAPKKIKMSTATDVFSLGCLFFFVLTKGLHPFGGPGDRQYNIRRDKPQLKKIELDGNWMKLVKKMICRNPSERPSAQNILTLECFVPQGPPSPMHKNSKDTLVSSSQDPVPTTEPLTPLSSPLPNNKYHSKPNPKTESHAETSTKPLDRLLRSITSKWRSSKFAFVDENGNNGVFRAVLLSCPVSKISQMIKVGTEWNIKNSLGQTVLHLATQGGHAEILEYFIRLGGNINSADSEGELPLHKVRFAKQNFKETLDVLLEHNVDINAPREDGTTILALTAREGRSKDKLECIIRRGGNLALVNECRLSALHLAAQGGNVEAIKYFISLGAEMAMRSNNGESVIHQIRFTKQNFKGTLDFLVESGVEINGVRDDGNAILGLAALQGRSKDELKYIVSKGGDLYQKSLPGHCVLHLAAEGGNYEAIKYFVTAGVDINSRSNKNETPLHRVQYAKQNFKRTLNVLLDLGAEINDVREDGNTVLALVAFEGRSKEDVAHVISKGGNFDRKNLQRQSILECARIGGNAEVLEFLMELLREKEYAHMSNLDIFA